MDVPFGLLSPEWTRTFIVLRNHEGLPHTLTGSDLDLCVRHGLSLRDGLALIRKSASAVEWRVLRVTARPFFAGVALVPNNATNAAAALHFDIFDGIRFRNIPLLRPEDLEPEVVSHHRYAYLTSRARTLVTLVHHLAWTGSLSKNKYLHEAAHVISQTGDRLWLEKQLAHVFGFSLTTRIIASLAGADTVTNFNGALPSRSFIRRRVLWQARERLGAPAVARAYAGYYYSQIPSLIRPSGGVVERGARHPNFPQTLEQAVNASPHSFFIPKANGHPRTAYTPGPTRYGSSIRAMLVRTRILRNISPTIFLWFMAKRGRFVFVDSIPPLLAAAHRVGIVRSWVARS